MCQKRLYHREKKISLLAKLHLSWGGDWETLVRVNVCLARVVWEASSNESLSLPESRMGFCS